MWQWFSRRGWESSQERVAVVQAGDGQHLDQELGNVFCEDQLDSADDVECEPAGLGHSSDAGGTVYLRGLHLASSLSITL